MANNHIITSNTIQENPRVEESGNQTLKTFSVDERTKFFDQYWSDEDLGGRRRKVFPIEVWKLASLFKKTGEVGFLVKNINNSNKVTARWMSFDKTKWPRTTRKPSARAATRRATTSNSFATGSNSPASTANHGTSVRPRRRCRTT